MLPGRKEIEEQFFFNCHGFISHLHVPVLIFPLSLL